MLMDYRVYKLSRAGILLNGRVLFPPLIAYIIIGALYGVYAYKNSLSGYMVFYFLLTVFFVIFYAVRISRKPIDFTVEEGKIIFVEHLKSFAPTQKYDNNTRVRLAISHTAPKYTTQNWGKNSGNGKSKPVIIRVRDITAIKYSSNLVERAFNLGHIRIDGKVFLRNADDTACHDVHAPKVIEISGIRDFRRVCRELETVFPYAEHKGIKY